MKLFRDDNTEGYTSEELDALNAEWEARVRKNDLEIYTDEYNLAADWFVEEVSRRGAKEED